MTTATTTTVIDHTSDAGFRTWVAEVITMLFTTLGVTQTADTGQINTATVTRPGINTNAGYVIGRLNDALQSTSPIFFKLEFGTAGNAAAPKMALTLGQGSNGAGALTGLTTVASVSCGGATPTSTVTGYITRGCYSATAGFLGLAWKIGGATTNQTLAGFAIFRSADNTGAPTADAVMLLTNSALTTVNASSGWAQAISYLAGIAYTTGVWPSSYWGSWPFDLASSLYSGNAQVGPVFQYTPVLGVTPWLALGLVGELAVGSTASLTLVGSTPHTYLAVGTGAAGNVTTLTNSAYTATGGAASTLTLLMLWE